MDGQRRAFQGVVNIVRFNRQFYLGAIGLMLLLFVIYHLWRNPVTMFLQILSVLALAGMIISLSVSFYVYDLSGLYSLSWLDKTDINPRAEMLNIHAGFDETSALLKGKYPGAGLHVFDFYDPQKHTEISIRRARKASPPFPGTQAINTSLLPLPNESVETIFLTLAAHEIRDDGERIVFFRELYRVLKNSGKIIVTEHQRDLPNFLAYNIGFLHFLSKANWLNTFRQAGFAIQSRFMITPFITNYILRKNGAAS